MSYTDVTPYVAAQIATQALREAGLLDSDVEIAPQSMYGNKTIARYGTSRREGGDGIMFVGDSFKEWLDAQLEGRQGGTRTRVNLKALMAEYGEDAPETDEAGQADEVSESDEQPVDDGDAEVSDLERQLAASQAAIDGAIEDALPETAGAEAE